MPLTLTWGSSTPVVTPIFTTPVVTLNSPTSVTISWHVSPASTGQVEYDTDSGAPYASSSTAEPSYLTFHSQLITGLTAGTTYYFRVTGTTAAAVASATAEATFSTASSLDFDTGYTYTDYTVPTGATWTDGTDCRTALQAWFDAIPNGASATSHTRVIFTAGYTWTMSGSLRFYGRSHITFWGQGTPLYAVDGNGQITSGGNSGGGKVKRTHVGTGGDVTNFPAFSTGQGGTTYRATDIRFCALQVEGGMSAGIDLTSTMADAGNEFAHAFDFYGLDGGLVAYCNTYRTTGDAIAINGSAGAVATDPSDVRTRNLVIRNNWLRSAGRVGIFLGKASATTVQDNLFQDSAYAFMDFEPDYEHMRIGATTIQRNSFTGRCNWDTTYYMSSIFMSRVTSRPGTNWQIDGAVTIDSNVWADLHNRNPGTYELHATFGPLLKTAAFSFTNNKRVANSHTGPALLMANFSAGGTITGNAGFGSTPTFASISSSGSFTQSGNS